MIRLIGLVLLWSFLLLDIIMLRKTGTDMVTGSLFMSIRTIPLIMVTMGG